MKAIFFLLLLTFSLQAFAQAPGWLWAHGATSVNGGSIATCVGTDTKGNAAIAGSFGEDVTFASTTLIKSPGNTTDFYVALYTRTGSLLWAKRIGGVVQSHGEIKKVTIDSMLNVYVFGYYQDSAEFTDTSMRTPRYTSIFVAKYDSLGNRLWVKTVVTNVMPYDDLHQTTYQFSAACNGKDKFYIVATAKDTFICDTKVLIQHDPGNMFLATYDFDGNVKEADLFLIGGTCYSTCVASDLETDYIYVAGQRTSNRAFVVKLGANASIKWQEFTAGTLYAISRADGIAVSPQGYVYVCGTFSDTIIFGSTQFFSFSSFFDGYVMKMKTDKTFQWVRHFGGNRVDEAHDITVDENDNAYVTGYVQSRAAFGSHLIEELDDARQDVAFVAKYATDGQEQWAVRPEGHSYSSGRGITLSQPSGLLFVAGGSAGALTFGPISLTGGAFLAAMDINAPAEIVSTNNLSAKILIYPMPARSIARVHFDLPIASLVTVELIDAIGRTVYHWQEPLSEGVQDVSLNLQQIPKGYYQCRVTAGSIHLGSVSLIAQ
jgi:hypothetical protein